MKIDKENLFNSTRGNNLACQKSVNHKHSVGYPNIKR